MLGIGLALVWFGAVSLALVVRAFFERRARLVREGGRPGFAPPRAPWGGGLVEPPAHAMLARALASGARMVRTGTRIGERARGLRFAARAVACVALASALALVPFASRLASLPGAPPVVVVDLPHGLVALLLLVLLAALAQVAVGLSETSPFARLACVRLAGRVLVLVAVLVLVLAPLALATGSFRLHAIVMDQQATFSPAAILARAFARAIGFAEGPISAGLASLALPAWFLFRQPLTALLFLPVLGLLVHRPLAQDPVGGTLRLSAFGQDDDPGELYWARMEERLATLLFGALFVALFLGGGALPYVSSAQVVAPLVPFFGTGLPALVAAAIETAVFVLKLVLVLAGLDRAQRASAALRDDHWIRLATRRALPLAFANLLLVAGTTLIALAGRSGGAP